MHCVYIYIYKFIDRLEATHKRSQVESLQKPARASSTPRTEAVPCALLPWLGSIVVSSQEKHVIFFNV